MSLGDQVEQVEQGIQALDMLAAEAAEIDAEMGPAPDAVASVVQPAPAADPVAETAAMLTVAVQALAPLRPYLTTIYTEQAVGAIAGAYVGLAEKYGWATGGGLFERWGPEITAAAVGIPLIVATSQAEKAYRAEQEAAEGGAPDGREDKHVEDDQGQQQSGPSVVSFGSGVVS